MSDLIQWGKEEIGKLRRDMDRMFDALCFDLGLPGPSGGTLCLSEEPDRLLVTLQMPGLKGEDLDLAVNERTLIVAGKRTVNFPGGYRTSSFRREISLPCRVVTENVSAEIKGDVLGIILPKCDHLDARPVPVNGR